MGGIDRNDIGIVILAAGESRRFGSPKQLINFDGGTLLNWVILNAVSSKLQTTVVLGAHADEISKSISIAEKTARIVINENWEAGMGSSIATGLTFAIKNNPDLEGIIFLLCDQPLVTSATIEKLIMAQKASGSNIVASEYEDSLGVPALFTRKLFPELIVLDGHKGAKSVIDKHENAGIVRVFAPENAFDIDTQEDLKRLTSLNY